MNPDDYDDLPDSFMNQPVACFSMMQDGKCAAIIGYPRNSIIQASCRYMKYGDCLRAIVSFHDMLPSSQKEITSDLVSMLQAEVHRSGKVVQRPVHINKFVFYSVFIDRIIVITRKYKLPIIKRIPLVYAAILSELPDHFINATKKYVNCSKEKIPIDVMEFTMVLYNDI